MYKFMTGVYSRHSATILCLAAQDPDGKLVAGDYYCCLLIRYLVYVSVCLGVYSMN